MNVNTFWATLDDAGGFNRPNRYQVIIPTQVLSQNSSAIANAINNAPDEFAATDATDWLQSNTYSGGSDQYRLTAFCDKSELPGYQFQMDNQRIYGPSFKFPHMPEWADVTMSFMVGADFEERAFFESWMYMVMDPISNNFNYITEYAADIQIWNFDELDNLVYTTTLTRAYPISIGQMQLSYEDNNSVSKLQVTFTYKYGHPPAGTGLSGSTAGRGGGLFNSTIIPPGSSNGTPGANPTTTTTTTTTSSSQSFSVSGGTIPGQTPLP